MSTRAWAHAIVRRYPQAWRERYETEVRGLIDDTPIQFRDLGELLRGVFTERAREVLTSVDNPRRTATILGLVAPVAGGAFILVAWLTGYAVKSAVGPLSDSAENAAGVLMVGLLVAYLVTWFRGWTRRDRSSPMVPFSPPLGFVLVLLPILFVEAALFAAFPLEEPTYRPLIPMWIQRMWLFLLWAGLTGNLMSSVFPGHELLLACAKVSYADGQIRANEKWVEGCHDMISKGVASPLGNALAEVDRWTVERDRARARLQTLGYRARFRQRADCGPGDQVTGASGTEPQ